jgi:hypothetical protein
MKHLAQQEVVNWTGAVVGVGLVGIMAFVTWALVFVTVPTENQTSLVQLVGNLTGLIGIVVGFYFGSSSTQKKQADTIDSLAKTAQTAGVALGQPDAMVIPPGTSATATATPEGTVITPDTKP